MIVKQALAGSQSILVTFSLPSTLWSDDIRLVGDFNDWDQSSHRLELSSDGSNWEITIQLPRSGIYEFRYLINQTEWCCDSAADRYVSNPYGGYNSVVET